MHAEPSGRKPPATANRRCRHTEEWLEWADANYGKRPRGTRPGADAGAPRRSFPTDPQNARLFLVKAGYSTYTESERKVVRGSKSAARSKAGQQFQLHPLSWHVDERIQFADGDLMLWVDGDTYELWEVDSDPMPVPRGRRKIYWLRAPSAQTSYSAADLVAELRKRGHRRYDPTILSREVADPSIRATLLSLFPTIFPT